MTKKFFATDTVVEATTIWKYKGQVFHTWEDARRVEYEDRLDSIMHRLMVSAEEQTAFLRIIDFMGKADLDLLADYIKLRGGQVDANA